ncbi:hypothetical protein BIFDEN_00729 [Bifidobacterium dentium ATCC 27678]|nr:hypothetical protein BIFDEN_00729 [Bifidobacterium dentium ATCC 27678]
MRENAEKSGKNVVLPAIVSHFPTAVDHSGTIANPSERALRRPSRVISVLQLRRESNLPEI